jgi:hypothetical protein
VHINANDEASFVTFQKAMGGEWWVDCNLPGVSACDSCAQPSADHHITCVTQAVTTSSTGRRLSVPVMERRITEIVLRNINATGVVPVTALNALTSLMFVDLSSDADSATPNDISLPANKPCANIKACQDASVGCNFNRGDTCNAPVCDDLGLPITTGCAATSRVNTVAIGAAVGSILFLLLLGGLLAYYLATKKQRDRAARRRKRKAAKKSEERRMQRDMEDAGYNPNVARLRSGESQSRLDRTGSRKSMSRKSSKKAFKTGYRPDSQAPESQWSQAFDYQSGATYWINNVTGAFSWTPPAGMGVQQPPAFASGGSMRAPPPPIPSASFGGMTPAPPMSRMPAMAPPMAAGAFGAAPGGFGSAPGRGFGNSYPQPGGPLWEEIYDSATDSSYWVNPATGQFSWQNPMGP